MKVGELRALLLSVPLSIDDDVVIEAEAPCKDWFTPGGEAPTVSVKGLYAGRESPKLVLVPEEKLYMKREVKHG